jgi:RHS repeat-associated protein
LIEYSDGDGNPSTPDDIFVKTKTQIDAANYAEVTKYFDGLGREYKVKVKDTAGDIFTETQFDNMSRPFKTSNPYRQGQTLLWTETEFDSAGRVWKVKAPLEQNQTQPAVSETTYGLLTTGNLIGVWVSAKDPAGKELRSVTDSLGRLVRADEPTANGLGTPESPNQATFYTYDLLGKLRKVTQGEQSRFFAYDSLGRLIRAKNVEQDANTQLPAYTDPITGNTQWSQAFTYDNNGNIVSQVTARNITITNGYDALNRVVTRNYSDGITPNVSYFYDGKGLSQVPDFSKGKLTKVTNGVSENRFVSFDVLGKVLTSQQITDGQTYETADTYDSFGKLISEKYPSGRIVTNSFDSLGRLASISSAKQANATPRIYANGFGYTLNENGLEARMRLGNGLWEKVELNHSFQPVEISLGTSASQANRLKLNYSYGVRDASGNLDVSKNNGNVESQTITVPVIGTAQGFTTTQFYEYDELNRIKRAYEKPQGQQQADWQQQFSYDRYGNRTIVTNNNATTESLVGPNPEINTATNRIIPRQNSNEQYLFDASGNMTRDAVGNIYAYDAENHQKIYTPVNPSLPQATYFYDGNGARVKKQVGNEVTIFVYNAGGKLVAEYTQNTPPNTTPQTNYITTDTLGSPRVNTNAKGEVIARHDYLPFGDEIIGLGQRAANQGYGMPDNTRQRFTGYEKDQETGLDFAQARYYGNGLGRFTSVDPTAESIYLDIPQTWNRYVYVLNNPLNLVDPSGLVPDGIIWLFDNVEGIYFSIPSGEYNPETFDSSRYRKVKSIGPDGESFILENLVRSYNTPENKDLLGLEVYLGVDGKFHYKEPDEIISVSASVETDEESNRRWWREFNDGLFDIAEFVGADDPTFYILPTSKPARSLTFYSKTGISVTGIKNIAKEILSRANYTKQGFLESILDDGTKILIRKDVGTKAHPIGTKYPNPVDHFNIEIHYPRKGLPGRYKLGSDFHLILDKAGNVVDIVKNKII